ncbi:MAG TPA: hypothetical protein VHD33_03355, partial [Legionellaceae bacterium]|nr:hypothetical protein [Legionellaceae bacterium]
MLGKDEDPLDFIRYLDPFLQLKWQTLQVQFSIYQGCVKDSYERILQVLEAEKKLNNINCSANDINAYLFLQNYTNLAAQDIVNSYNN